LIDEAPFSTLGTAHGTGWMRGEILLKRAKPFISFKKSSKDVTVLLIVNVGSSGKQVDTFKHTKRR
jgi:hypothetical protein